ncbi:MAG: sulfite exporter TauE/SafE family protein [Verrucomicrobia bacterium]|nr:sulfite exporter TauE/SafE family protein [Verrucomicrobiota bacterium]
MIAWYELLLFVVIFIVSFFSVVAGGVGLLTRPILILFGYPPEIAIGTFRIANLFSRIAGFVSLVQGKKVEMDWHLALFLFTPSLIGGMIGAEIVSTVNPPLIRTLLGIFVIIIGAVMLIERDLGIIPLHHRMTWLNKWIGAVSTVIIGIFAAFVGGSGILFAYLLIFNYDKSYLASAPIRKIANFGSALSASVIFFIHGTIDWRLMVLVLIADGLGEYFGGLYQMRKGADWIRRVTLIVVFASGLAMIFY